MDREILADIAGKTNKLGLRFYFHLSRLNSQKDLKAHLRSFVLFPGIWFPTLLSRLEPGQTPWKSRLLSLGERRLGEKYGLNQANARDMNNEHCNIKDAVKI